MVVKMSQKRNKNNRKKQNEQDIVQTDRNVSEAKVDNDTEAQLLQELEDIGKEQLQDISSRVRALIGSDKEAVRNFNSQRRKEQEEKQKEEKAKEKAANEREAKEKEAKEKEAKQKEAKQKEYIGHIKKDKIIIIITHDDYMSKYGDKIINLNEI